MAAYRAWISPKKKWSCASCLPLELHMPPDIRENTKQTKKTQQLLFAFLRIQAVVAWGLLLPESLLENKAEHGISAEGAESQLENWPIDLGVKQPLFFWGRISFLHKRSHEDSWSPWSQPKPEDKNNFTDEISQKMEETLNFRRKATQNSPRLCKGEEGKGIFLQLQVRKKGSYLSIYIFIYYVYITKDRTTLGVFCFDKRGGKKQFSSETS